MLPRLAVLILSACALVGCAAAPSAEAIASAPIGEKPSLEEGREAALFVVKGHSVDPSSVQVIWGGDWQRGWFKEPFKEARASWALPFSVNAKNKVGGYVGFKPASLHVIDGVVVALVWTRESAYGTESPQVIVGTQGLTVAECAAKHASVFGQLVAAPAK